MRLAARARSPGSGSGCSFDTALFQTLGVTSLLYIVIGYWSGRLRWLGDPLTRARAARLRPPPRLQSRGSGWR